MTRPFPGLVSIAAFAAVLLASVLLATVGTVAPVTAADGSGNVLFAKISAMKLGSLVEQPL